MAWHSQRCGNHYKIFAVEFDTSHDREFGDPNDDHVGINAGTVVSFKTANSSEATISLHSSSVHRAWIIYNGDQRWIDVHLGVDGDPIPKIPILSSPLNLSPFLKEYMFVGFSASTGNSTQIHNILSWNFSSVSQAFIQLPSGKTCHRNIVQQVSKYSSANVKHYGQLSSFFIFVAVLGLCTVSLLIYFKGSEAKESSISLWLFENKQRPVPPGKLRRFNVLEVQKATRGFSESEVLTSDSGGVLYRGTLGNGRRVAVKRWFSTTRSVSFSYLHYSSRIPKRIGELTQVNHSNLATIRGWCCESNEIMIFYHYYQYGSMDRWLFGICSLPWTRRLRPIKDVAEALSYLHRNELVHGNLKSSSVFFDVDYKAVLGDYGFVNFCEGLKERDMGKKEDVFQFGILVMEMVAGKKNEGTEWLDEGGGGGGEKGVLGFARRMYGRGEMVKMVDKRMVDRVNFEEAILRVLIMGLNCTAIEVERRPYMEEVVHFFNLMQSLNFH